MKYNNIKIKDEFEKNLREAKQSLNNLSFHQVKEVPEKLIKGWVFEQTIAKCLKEEFNNNLEVEQQYRFSKFKIQHGKKSRGIADLVIISNNTKIFVEIKHSGIFEKEDFEKYSRYRKLIEDNGFEYLYFSKREKYSTNVIKSQGTFGYEKTFILEEYNNEEKEGDWERFVKAIEKRVK